MTEMGDAMGCHDQPGTSAGSARTEPEAGAEARQAGA